MEVSFNSYYLYKKYEKRANQPWLPVYPETLSIDGDGSMPKVLKTSGDPVCYVEPQERWVDSGEYACEEITTLYRWLQTEDTICIEKFEGKYKLTLNNSSIISAECNSTSSVTSGDVSSRYSGSVISAVIGDCVTSIGRHAFDRCSGLTNIILPDSLTSIDVDAFRKCTGLTSIDIPSSVTTIGAGAFTQCYSLSSIVVPDSVVTINGIFINCTGLTSVTLSDNATSIGQRAFNGCSSLTSVGLKGSGASVEIPSGVTEICGTEVFASCTSLTSVTLSDNITCIGNYAFYNCTALTSITILAITPPTLGVDALVNTNDCPIYVPSGSVNAYKTTHRWPDYASRIFAIP